MDKGHCAGDSENGRATRMIVKPGDKIKLYPEERTGQKAIGWKVEYLREYNVSDSTAPVHKIGVPTRRSPSSNW